ncbi:GNAT family N-acetyltransferase [Pseudoduganella chitinolytica]|uniref:GNAT family N-acetyltransferase n=1 Tax=Pseudoduganella chitinolytica TaxID=34070 RepID=A0ABY8BHG0_9BURK|nr:GNAT family N-acetyltransferase [Pseudoduganella chitinolytica]WEF35370.1 GNAT family N-acetyltransferase [Pseudoduganella chitinolytica]
MVDSSPEAAAPDNPVWTALAGSQRHLAHALGDMLRFPADVAPFCAVPEEGTFVPSTDLEYLTEDAYFLGALPTVPAGWELRELSTVTQMVYTGAPVAAPPAAGVTVLDALDPAMQELTALAFPGYFRARTGIMGRYVGIRDGDQLVALAGERMDFGSSREVSAVCTHPDHAGQGYARLLIQHVMHGMQEQGVTPMLHVGSGNARAIALYEALGFVRVRQLRHARLQTRG